MVETSPTDIKECPSNAAETRRSIVDAILAIGNLTGDKQYHEFAKIVCPSITEDEISEVARHMNRFDD